MWSCGACTVDHFTFLSKRGEKCSVCNTLNVVFLLDDNKKAPRGSVQPLFLASSTTDGGASDENVPVMTKKRKRMSNSDAPRLPVEADTDVDKKAGGEDVIVEEERACEDSAAGKEKEEEEEEEEEEEFGSDLSEEAKLFVAFKDHKDSSFHYFSKEEARNVVNSLADWWENSGERRKLPWRGDAEGGGTVEVTPYHTWVSEVMCQQTKITAVIPYYEKFIKEFPTVQSLAAAESFDNVNALWAGLGYMSRAKNLYLGAQQVVADFNGVLPNNILELQKIRGIGPYTAGAIASIAYHKKEAVVDGNVQRVISRLRGIVVDSKAGNSHKLIWKLAKQLIDECDDEDPAIINQALMEMGATYCQKTSSGIDEKDPLKDLYMSTKLGTGMKELGALATSSSSCQCEICTKTGIQNFVTSFRSSLIRPNSDARTAAHALIPPAAKKSPPKVECYAVVILTKENKFAMVKRPEKGLLAGQYEFLSILVDNTGGAGTDRGAGGTMIASLLDEMGCKPGERLCSGAPNVVTHKFSGVTHHYRIFSFDGEITDEEQKRLSERGKVVFMTKGDILNVGMTVNQKNILNAFQNRGDGGR